MTDPAARSPIIGSPGGLNKEGAIKEAITKLSDQHIARRRAQFETYLENSPVGEFLGQGQGRELAFTIFMAGAAAAKNDAWGAGGWGPVGS